MVGINMGYCCWPSRLLLWWSVCAAVLCTPLGGLIVWLGVRLKKQELFDGIDGKYCPLVIIAFGGWLIVVGLVGVVALARKTKVGAGFFGFLLFVTACVLIALAGEGLHISQNLYQALDSQEDCKGNDYLAQANDAAQLANAQLCSAVCPCNITPDLFGEQRFTSLFQGSATSIQDCTPCESAALEMQSYKQQADYCDNGGNPNDFQSAYYAQGERRYFPLIAMLEREFDCAGVCQDEPYFAFTDVSRGVPKKNCREDFREWVGVEPLRYCAVIVSVGFLLIIHVLCPCCLTCQGFPKSSKGYDHAPTSTQV